MSPIATHRIRTALSSKGFREIDTHHHRYILYVRGKKSSIFTKVSHGEKECNDHLVSVMARQIRLTKRQFVDLVNCPLTAEAYLDLLVRNGVIAQQDV